MSGFPRHRAACADAFPCGAEAAFCVRCGGDGGKRGCHRPYLRGHCEDCQGAGLRGWLPRGDERRRARRADRSPHSFPRSFRQAFNFDTAYFFNTVNSGTNDRTAVFVGSDKTVLIYGNYTLLV